MRKTPEECGIGSIIIKKYLEELEKVNLSTHSIIMARGNDIFFEKYYPPFDENFLHRIYSDTKSFVSIAVGFAEQEGLLNLDDNISKYFPKECENLKDTKIGEQTIRQMLMMSTPKIEPYWFDLRTDDRVRDYFHKTVTTGPLGSKFYYDSSGSFILGVMVERVTGKTLVDYLYEKLFSKIDVSRDAVKCLKAPGGHSWGDSAMLMRPLDLVKVIRFLLDKGRVKGEQILNEDFINDATGNLISTEGQKSYSSFGYGYLIWRTYENSFFFNGMGAQYAMGCPDKDLIFIYNCDAQGMDEARTVVLDKFFEIVYHQIGDPLSKNPENYVELNKYAESLKLFSEKGKKYSITAEKINGKTFKLEENEMGIKYVKFSFNNDFGTLEYKNAQGVKKLEFGICENYFTLFPEDGYSRDVGSVSSPGNYYKCACSAAWKTDTELAINVQVIDEYFGRLWMTFYFNDNGVEINMKKAAEDFFTTYRGVAKGKIQL